jgi:hypothetical protein
MGPGSRPVRVRARIAIVAVLLTSLAVLPAVAFSKTASKHHGHIPSCAKLSRKAIENLAGTGTLKLKKHVATFCAFTGEHPDHYEPQFQLGIIPYIAPVWQTEKADATRSAAKNGSHYGQVNSHLFFVTGENTSAGLPPCTAGDGSPGKGGSKLGPACAGEPSLEKISVYGNGTDKRVHLHLMVSAGVTGQQGDVHLSHMLALVKDIISGKIH